MGNTLPRTVNAQGDWPTECRMTKIALISPYAASIVSFRGALIRDLKQAGAEIYVLAPDYTPVIRSAVAELGATPLDYPLDRTGMNPLQDLRTLIALWCILKRLHPDIIIPYNIKPVIYGALAGALTRIPQRIALIEGLGVAFIDAEHTSFKNRILKMVVKMLYRMALRQAHKVLFLNPDDQRELVQYRIVDSGKAFLLGGIGVDLEEWCPASPVLQPITFTLAARLLREKGIVEFAESARQIKQSHPQARFVLLGGLDTNPGAIQREQVEQWVQEGILEWFGQVPDVRPYFAQSSVYVLPSYREGVPRSTQEAMAMARPIITTDAPGCRETVAEGENGFLIPPRNVPALVKAMEYFIQNPHEIVRMGQASRRIAEERFDVRKINQKIIGILGIGNHVNS